MDLEAFYLPLGGNRFAPTRATESPWDTDAQHGGPPSALLAHLAADAARVTGAGSRPARISVDFFGAIPAASSPSRSPRSARDGGST